MTTHSELMTCLLAVRGRCIAHRDRSRRRHLYDRGQVLGSVVCPVFGLLRHLCGVTPVEVSLLPRGVVRPPDLGSLVAVTGLAHRLLPRESRARSRAVPVAVVAPGAEKEDLAAPSAGHEP
jgi:hypothetical protein